MALEMGVSTLAVLGSSVVLPKLWKWTKAALHYGVQSLKNGLNYMKGKINTNDCNHSTEFVVFAKQQILFLKISKSCKIYTIDLYCYRPLVWEF